MTTTKPSSSSAVAVRGTNTGSFGQFLGQAHQPGGNFSWGHRDPAVGVGPGEGHSAFQLQMVGKAGRSLLQVSSLNVVSGELHRRNPGTQKIGLEAGNDTGPVETVMGQQPAAMSTLVGIQYG